MKIEFVASVPSESNKDLLDRYAVYTLIGSAIAEVSDTGEHEKLSELKPDTRYKITIEEI